MQYLPMLLTCFKNRYISTPFFHKKIFQRFRDNKLDWVTENPQTKILPPTNRNSNRAKKMISINAQSIILGLNPSLSRSNSYLEKHEVAVKCTSHL